MPGFFGLATCVRGDIANPTVLVSNHKLLATTSGGEVCWPLFPYGTANGERSAEVTQQIQSRSGGGSSEAPGRCYHAQSEQPLYNMVAPLEVQLEDLDRFAKEVTPTFRDTRTAAAAQ